MSPRALAVPVLALAAAGLAGGCSPVPPAAAPGGGAVDPTPPRTATAAAEEDAPPASRPAQAGAAEVAEAPETADPTGAAATAAVGFETEILPILSGRCRPCHFEGGKMYERLPFDRPETIRTLGTRLFTRIKEPREQERIRAFLAADGGGSEAPD